MSPRQGLKVFSIAARLGFRQALDEKLALLGSLLIYAAIIVSYSGVIRAIPARELAAHGLAVPDLIWYLGLTEFVLFCSSTFQVRELQHDIQSGRIDLALTRPCPLWVLRLGEGGGQFVARLLILLAPCLALTSILAGEFRLGPQQLAGQIFSTLLACPLLVSAYFMIGASSFWIKDAGPVFWIWQKSLFLLGGLLWPLALYPPLLGRLVWLTPFPAVLAAPAQWGQPVGAAALAGACLHQALWGVLFLLAAAWVDRTLMNAMRKGGPS